MSDVSKGQSKRALLIAGLLATVLILFGVDNRLSGRAAGGGASGCGAPPAEVETESALTGSRSTRRTCSCDGHIVDVTTWCGRRSRQNASGKGLIDDAPAIQQALSCLNSLAGVKNKNETGVVGTLYFPAGIYLIGTTIQVPTTSHYQGIRITGESQQTSALLMKTDQAILRFGSTTKGQSRSSRFELSHLAVINQWGPNATSMGTSPAIEIHQGQFAHIHDVAVFSSNTALKLNGLEFSAIKRVHVWPPWGAYVYSKLLPPTKATLSALAQSKATMFDLRSDAFPVLDVAFEDCIVNAGGTAYLLQKGPRPFANVSIRGGFVQNLSQNAIEINSSASRARNISIKNLHMEQLSATSHAVSASHVDQLLIESLEIPNEGLYGIRLEDAMRTSVRNSSNIGVLELLNPESLSLVLEHSYFAGLTPEDALDKLKERSIIGTTVLGHSAAYGLKTPGEVVAERVIVDGFELGRAVGVAHAKAAQDQQLPSGATLRTQIDFTDEDFDRDELFTNDGVQITRPGYYRFDVSVTLKSIKANSWVKLFLYRNNGEATRLSWDSAVADTPRRTYTASTIVKAKADDEFSIRLTHNGSGSLSTDSAYGTFLQVQYLGK